MEHHLREARDMVCFAYIMQSGQVFGYIFVLCGSRSGQFCYTVDGDPNPGFCLMGSGLLRSSYLTKTSLSRHFYLFFYFGN
jgi:hypothetical protein